MSNSGINTEPITNTEPNTGFIAKREILNSGISLLHFTFEKTVKDTHFATFLAVLDKALQDKKSFCLLIDARKCSNVPIRSTLTLSSWMKKRKPDIPGILLGFSVVIDSQIIVNLINTAFRIQRPTSKHIITKHYENAYKFLQDIRQ